MVNELRDDSTVAVGFSSLTLVSTVTDAPRVSRPRAPRGHAAASVGGAGNFGLPVAVENDANAAALGESRFGVGRGVNDMVMLVVGTGVGGGLILNGALYRGAGGVAGELGQITLKSDGDPRSLEDVASGVAIDQMAADLAAQQPDSDVGRAAGAGKRPDARLLLELAEREAGAARAAVDEVGWLMGLGVCSIVDVFNPALVVLGGGVFDQGLRLLQAIRRTVAERVLPPARDDVEIVRSTLGSPAGTPGAAIAAFTQADSESTMEEL